MKLGPEYKDKTRVKFPTSNKKEKTSTPLKKGGASYPKEIKTQTTTPENNPGDNNAGGGN